MGSVFNSKKPNKDDYEGYQPDEDLRSRYLAVIDKYLTEKGMTNYIPRESRPYELRSAEERGDWRNATGAQVNEAGGINKPTLNDGVRFDNQKPVNTGAPIPAGNNPNQKMSMARNAGEASTVSNAMREQAFNYSSPPLTERQVSSQAIAPIATAPQGNQVPLTANTAFFQEDERRKQEEYNRVKDYIYRDQRSR